MDQSEQRRRSERRRLWDRRAPFGRRGSEERRTRDRRAGVGEAPTERRASDRRRNDRRTTDRRITVARRRGRRRRETPTPYTAEQIAELRTRFAAPGMVHCPACGSGFSLGPGRRRGDQTARRVACHGCGRAAVVPNTRAARVLVVDQHAARRDALQTILAGAGHEVIETADAAVALAAYQVVPADVILIDVQSPGRMPATEFLRQLRRTFPEARVVAMAARSSYTGGADPLAVIHGLGAVRTLRMPITREDVLKTVEEARS